MRPRALDFSVDPLDLDADIPTFAERFHDAYERLAPSFGYEDPPSTKPFNPDSPNGRLMQAVIKEVIGPVLQARDSALLENDRLQRANQSLRDQLTERTLRRRRFLR